MGLFATFSDSMHKSTLNSETNLMTSRFSSECITFHDGVIWLTMVVTALGLSA